MNDGIEPTVDTLSNASGPNTNAVGFENGPSGGSATQSDGLWKENESGKSEVTSSPTAETVDITDSSMNDAEAERLAKKQIKSLQQEADTGDAEVTESKVDITSGAEEPTPTIDDSMDGPYVGVETKPASEDLIEAAKAQENSTNTETETEDLVGESVEVVAETTPDPEPEVVEEPQTIASDDSIAPKVQPEPEKIDPREVAASEKAKIAEVRNKKEELKEKLGAKMEEAIKASEAKKAEGEKIIAEGEQMIVQGQAKKAEGDQVIRDADTEFTQVSADLNDQLTAVDNEIGQLVDLERQVDDVASKVERLNVGVEDSGLDIAA